MRSAWADVMYLARGRETARIIAFDRQQIRYQDCETGAEQVVPWSQVSEVRFGPCKLLRAEQARPARASCADAPLNVFIVQFQHSTGVFENAVLTDTGLLHLDAFNPWEQAHGPIKAVRSIARDQICRDEILPVKSYPATYCHEPRQIAVAFDYDHPFDNHILTNGFSFHTSIIGRPPRQFDIEQFEADVRNGFHFGISAWTTGFVDHAELLTPRARQFVSARTSSSTSFSLFTPPQVIRLKCRQNATFDVALVFRDHTLFPAYPLALARARIEGRAIALNMGGMPCFHTELKYTSNRQPVWETANGCVNLIPILTHELGHAFGLKHPDAPGEHSIMDGILSRDTLAPTALDISHFLAVLNESVEGTSPGRLEFVSSSGVRPPVDWNPPKAPPAP